jgi:hypothetical protein
LSDSEKTVTTGLDAVELRFSSHARSGASKFAPTGMKTKFGVSAGSHEILSRGRVKMARSLSRTSRFIA